MNKSVGPIIGWIMIISILVILEYVIGYAIRPNNCGDKEMTAKYEDMLNKKITPNSKFLSDYHKTEWKCNNFHRNVHYSEQEIDMLIEKKVQADILILTR